MDAELKREVQLRCMDLRAYYTLNEIALTCKVPIGSILDVINGHILPDKIWQSIEQGTRHLMKEKEI